MPASSLQSCPRSSPRRARNALLSVLGTSSHMKKNKGWVSMPFEGSQVFSEGFDNFSSYSCVLSCLLIRLHPCQEALLFLLPQIQPPCQTSSGHESSILKCSHSPDSHLKSFRSGPVSYTH